MGSEYTGEYGLTADELLEFHEGRWRILAESAADLMGCETIPSLREAEVLLELLRRTTGRWGLDQLHLPGRRAPERR